MLEKLVSSVLAAVWGIGCLLPALLIMTHALLSWKSTVWPERYCVHYICTHVTQQFCLRKFYICPQRTCTRKCP